MGFIDFLLTGSFLYLGRRCWLSCRRDRAVLLASLHGAFRSQGEGCERFHLCLWIRTRLGQGAPVARLTQVPPGALARRARWDSLLTPFASRRPQLSLRSAKLLPGREPLDGGSGLGAGDGVVGF